MTRLFADCGGSKGEWLLIEDGETIGRFLTAGINPAVNKHETIIETLATLSQNITQKVDELWFYGAGCKHGTAESMRAMLQTQLPGTQIYVNSDMLGAAQALCGRNEGIACILGTGANSCYYNGQDIQQNTPSLGYILGDEGGGAVLGRILINRLYKGIFPQSLKDLFESEMQTSLPVIIEHVYRLPGANRYLASFTYFLAAHRDDENVRGMLLHCFSQFFERNIRPYARPDLKVGFVGSLAEVFCEELSEAAKETGYEIGQIIKSPIDKIAAFHVASDTFHA